MGCPFHFSLLPFHLPLPFMMRELTSLWQSLGDVEYLHLLLEPLPLFGLALGLVFLIAGVLFKDGKMRMLALLVMAFSCVSVQPYLQLRAQAEPRILALQDPAYHALTKQQSELRTSTAWVYYSLGAACLVALVLGRGGKAFLFNTLIIVLACAGLVHAIWLHKKECEVFHRNIVKFVPVR